jgi:hypothetical protein
MRRDLLPPRARGLEIRRRVAANLRLAARAALDLVPESDESVREFGAVDCGRERLTPKQLPRLQRSDPTVRRLGQIEDADVRVELRGGIAICRSRAVMLECRGDPGAGRFRRQRAAESGQRANDR